LIHNVRVFPIITTCFVNTIMMLDTWIASTLPLGLYCHLRLGLYIFIHLLDIIITHWTGIILVLDMPRYAPVSLGFA